MKGKTVGLMLWVLLGLGTQASANGGVISFKGQMVATACEAQPLANARSTQDTQLVQVSARITLAVNTYRNACSNDLIPFTTSYTALSNEQTPDVTPEAGVVTLTYQ
ncbi:MAG: hypothetical protein JWP80_2826 [Pseudomonas sp.]|nr:hypothetical protein [Pseudomonas sp.]